MPKKPSNIVLKLPSFLFHPLFLGCYALGYYFFVGYDFYDGQQILVISAPIIIITFLLPLMILFFLLAFKRIDTFMISKNTQRRLPLLLFGILLIFLLMKISKYDYFYVFYFFFFGVLISIFLALVASYFQVKASLHALGIIAFVCFLFGVNIYFSQNQFWFPLFGILLAGWVGASRLYMKAHSNYELFVGYLIGLIPQLFCFQFWL